MLWKPLVRYAHNVFCCPEIPAWMSSHTPNKLWDAITYPFPNFNGHTVEVWEWTSYFIPHFVMNLIGNWWIILLQYSFSFALDFNTSPLILELKPFVYKSLYPYFLSKYNQLASKCVSIRNEYVILLSMDMDILYIKSLAYPFLEIIIDVDSVRL